MTLTKKIGYNSSIQFLGRLIMVVISLVMITFLTRYLGLEKYGYYITAIAFVAIFSSFAEFGLDQIIIREVARHKRNKANIIGSGMVLKIIISAIVFALPPIIACSLNYPHEVKLGILICALATYPISISTVLVTIFQMHLQMYRYVIASITGRIITVAIGLFGIFSKKDIIFFFWAILIGNTIEFLIDLSLSKNLEKIKITFDKKLYKKMFFESWPMAIALGMGTIAFRIDTIILSLIKGQDAVGIYGVPYKVVDILIAIPNIFMGLVLPVIARYVVNNRRRLLKSMQKSMDAMAAVGFYVLMVITLLAPFIINLAAGSGFAASTAPLRYLAFAICAIFIGTPMPYLLVAARKQKQLIWRNLLLLVVNIALNLILIPYFSYNGAAIATVVAELTSTIFTFYLAWQTTKIMLSFRRFLGIIASAVISFLVGFAMIQTNVLITWQNYANLSYSLRFLAFMFVFLITSFFYFLLLVIFKGIDRRVAAELIPIKIKLENEK